jgi:hypothetical protein
MSLNPKVGSVFICGIVAAMTLAMLACDDPVTLLPIVYDEWWASDFATNTCEIGSDLPSNAVRNMCKDEARSEEAVFFGKLSGAFQSDPACAGMRLVTSDGFKDAVHGVASNNSERHQKALIDGYSKEHWFLMVSFSPKSPTQAWSVHHYTADNTRHDRSSRGKDNPYSLAHTVCSIAQDRSGR